MAKHVLCLLKPLVHQVLLSYIIIQYLISRGPEVQVKYSILVFYIRLLFSSITLLKHTINYTFKEIALEYYFRVN